MRFEDKIKTLAVLYRLSITSWIRSKKHNAAVGGQPTSQHLLGTAVDVVLDDPNDKGDFSLDAARLQLTVVTEGDHLHVQELPSRGGIANKLSIAAFLALLCFAAPAAANVLTWQDNSNNESGFSIEMLSSGTWQEVATVGPNITNATDSNTEGVYRVRAFIDVQDGQQTTRIFSAYSNAAALLNAPASLLVK